MRQIKFNRGWEFTLEREGDPANNFGLHKYLEATGAPAGKYDFSNWERVDLPHDWAVALKKDLRADTMTGARPVHRHHRYMTDRTAPLDEVFSVGWYRKQFSLDPAWSGKRIFLYFEGIFRDSTLFINGVYMDRHASGYTGFWMEITDQLIPGEINSVAVRVDCSQSEGWWYEGAGIYRNVFLWVGEPCCFVPNATVITAEIDGTVAVKTLLSNEAPEECRQKLCFTVRDPQGKPVAEGEKEITVPAYQRAEAFIRLQVASPALWDLDSPALYTLSIRAGEELWEDRFGFRSVHFDPEEGFFLNGRSVKIWGACVHQDFGGVGVALSDNLNDYKIRRLKEMGANAYRSAHHAPSPAILRACDEQGMLVMAETRTFGTSPEAIRQLTDLIERDRNHPCIFIWSLGNEEFSIQNDARFTHLMEKMTRVAKQLDPTRPVVYSGNNGEKYAGLNQASEIRGINYLCNGKGAWPERYHAAHPHQPMIGTEEASYVLSRGGAQNDLGSGKLDATGNVTMPWGATPKGWVKHFAKFSFLAGSFLWTGFDYRGEPSPFIKTNVSSSFGTIDLCGMEKPPFYYYKAWWTKEPVLKLAPHWNHKEGETVKIAVFTNCERLRLFINGAKAAEMEVAPYDMPQFVLPFTAGELTAEGEKDGVIYRDRLVTAGETRQLRSEEVLAAHSEEDVAIYELSAWDSQGNFCPLAEEELRVGVENGRIVGVGNGDPASLEDEQQSLKEKSVVLRQFSWEHGAYIIPPFVRGEFRRSYECLEYEAKREDFEDDYRLIAKSKDALEEPKTYTFTTKISGVEGYQFVEFERLCGAVTVYLNGKEIGNNLRNGRASFVNARSYRFYCDFVKGENELKVVVEKKESDPLPIAGTVKIAKLLTDAPHKVRLHYGKARVFVKSATPEKVKLNVALWG